MPRIAYMVIATLPDAALAGAYVRWLLDGHSQAVIAGGATVGEVIRLDADPSTTSPRVMSRYEFPSRESFDRYVRDTAPALRADGLANFGPDKGVKYERLLGEVSSLPPPSHVH